MFQVGALAALEDRLGGFKGGTCDAYVGSSSGASLAAALAAGLDVQRIYRAFLDPADDYFPLERRHILRMDIAEWGRTVTSAARALRQGARSLLSQSLAPSPAALWEELARLYDSMPAGVFSLEGYERFLEETFARRGVPHQFNGLHKPLRVLAHELDSGEPAIFGAPGLEDVSIARACCASMATPPLFSPVRIGDSHYINPSPCQVSHVEVAVAMGAKIIVVINPLVPLNVRRVPTGHGVRPSVRDKGAMWVSHQANRIKLQGLLHLSIERVRRETDVNIVLVEPDAGDGELFMHNPAGFGARRAILEYAFRRTRRLLDSEIEAGTLPLGRAGWTPQATSAGET
jgi:predicted acylesterase/phospholipase RssA